MSFPKYFIKPQPQFFPSDPLLFQTFYGIVPIEKYDYASFIILTKNEKSEYVVLMPTSNGKVSLYEQKIYNSDDSDSVLEKCMSFYGFTFSSANLCGKFTKLKHFEKLSGVTYKIGVLYLPSCSSSQIKNIFEMITHNNYKINEINLFHNSYQYDITTRNVLNAISNMIHTFI
jgi:hypothetical protein